MSILLGAVATVLTYGMFQARQMLLAFPSAIFWWLFGGAMYQLSAATWDLDYIVFLAAMFIGVFCMFAGFALRKKDLNPPLDDGKDAATTDGEEETEDQDGEDNTLNVATEDSPARTRLKERRNARSGRKPDFGVFR